jgi:hypothetical protein
VRTMDSLELHLLTTDFRLRDGRSIHTVSALLLQLVQTSAHGVRLQAKRLAKARQQALTMRRQESMADTPSEKPPGPFLDEKDNEVLFFPQKIQSTQFMIVVSGNPALHVRS